LILFAAVFLWTIQGSTTSSADKKTLEDIQSKLTDLGSRFDEYIKPRSLTAEQIRKLVEYLLPRDHFLLYIQYRDEDQEAKEYAQQFYSPLREAGLDARMQPTEYDGKLKTGGTLSPGITINYRLFKTPVVGVSRAAEILQRAFSAADVRVAGGGGGGPNANEPPQDDITVLAVGPRPLRIRPPTPYVDMMGRLIVPPGASPPSPMPPASPEGTSH
jgi:hypothetical protein